MEQNDVYLAHEDTPTMHLRWNGGVLEQLWTVRRQNTVTQQWRPVPQYQRNAETGAEG